VRPKVTVNCAMTADGKLATIERKQLRISSPEDLDRVKALRASSDAIMVGVGTVLADDPRLIVKGAPRQEQPLRVVVDSRGRTPWTARVVNDEAPTVIATSNECQDVWPNVDVMRCGQGRVDLEDLLGRLHGMGVRRLMVEGGGELIFSLFQRGLVDRYMVFVGPLVAGGRTAPTPADGEGFAPDDVRMLKLADSEVLGNGVLLTFDVD